MTLSRPELAGIVLVVLATLYGAAPAWAQARAPAVPTTSSSNPSATWHFGLSAGGNWTNNPFFIGTAPGTTWGASGSASLSHDHRFRTGIFTWSANGGALYYPEVRNLSQATYGGTANLAWSPGRRSRLSLRQDYQHSNTRNYTVLDVEGLPVPTSGLNSASSIVSFDQMLSRRWQLNFGGNFLYRRYDDPRLFGGDEVGGGVQIGAQAGRSGLVYLGYGYTASWIEGSALRAHQALVGFAKQPARGLSFEIAAGVGYIATLEEFYPSGKARLASRGRKASIEGRYERSFGQAFGYGRQAIADLFGVTATWSPVRRVTVSADYNFGYRREAGVEDSTINSWIASGGLNWGLGGGVGFAVRYAREYNDTYAGVGISAMGDTVTASLSYGVDWR